MKSKNPCVRITVHIRRSFYVMDSSTSFVPLCAQNDNVEGKNNLHTALVKRKTALPLLQERRFSFDSILSFASSGAHETGFAVAVLRRIIGFILHFLELAN